MTGGGIEHLARIYAAARRSDDGTRCAVAPHPLLRQRIKVEMQALHSRPNVSAALSIQAGDPEIPGLNDGMIIPPNRFPLGTAPSVIRTAAANRPPLRGAVRAIVVLVDFADRQMTQARSHFEQLFFSNGILPTKSVKEYYQEATHGLIDLQGEVVGPLRMPQTLAQYANNASGMGQASPNAATMARDAAVAADPLVNFDPYDNNHDGFVDAFIVVHAGLGAEVTGNPNDIWSHKWTLDGGALAVDDTSVFAYLTVPEDSLIGVCAHELGHLLFGFPDLYDTDGSSEGIGEWCLMAAGSWGGGGQTPVHPSAWCKMQQGWVSVDNRATAAHIDIPDVKTSHGIVRLWHNGVPSTEYFLLENRQQSGFDVSLPGSGLLIWHIDESISDNTNENHYKVALLQADGRRDLENAVNRGDAGDCFPGTTGNTRFDQTSNPSSNSYSGLPTGVMVSNIGPAGPVMTADTQV
jgi:immune inhibitor A